MTEITNTDAIKAWSRASQEIVVNFGDEGDFIRRYLLNPVIFELLGNVAGKTILDAGCGQGYLSRLLAKKGAMVTGIEPTEPWYTFEEPGSAWKEKGYVEIRDYFQERAVKQTYAHFIHRPLSTYLNSVIQEGCTRQKVIEPQLDEAIARQYHAERYWHVPGYLVIYAAKSS